MSLITINRSLVCEEQEIDDAGVQEIQNTSETASKSSHSEDFFLCKSSAVTLNVKSQRKTSVVRNHDNLHEHLKRILHTLRFTDYVKLIVKLENANPRPIWFRYLAIIATFGSQGDEEAVIIGLDVYQGSISIGFMLPILQDMYVKLDGDGGFKLATKDSVRLFKPVSVQALWAAHQAIMTGCKIAQRNGYHTKGPSHTWISHYQEIPASDAMMMYEWNKMEDIEQMGRASPPTTEISKDAITEDEKKTQDFKKTIRLQLLRIMAAVDLEDVNLVQLREMLEEQMGVSLKAHRHYIADQVLIIYGQMDAPSQIFDYLYLGSSFNASNGDELRHNNITHIVNVTREVENFFPADQYTYKNIRVYDDDAAQLLPFWDDTFKFINEARANGSRCLVHCKMGISRSGSTVVAYVMKEMGWNLEKALEFVKSKRACVNPNANFLRQLETYQGILEASSHRHSAIFQQNVSAKAIDPTLNSKLLPCNPEDGCEICMEEDAELEDADLMLSMPETYNTLADCGPTSAEHPIDLEAELFAFKAFSHLKETETEENEGRRASLVTDEMPPAGLKRTVLATTSQRIRHWHPDIYEDGGGGSGVVVCRSKSSPMDRQDNAMTPIAAASKRSSAPEQSRLLPVSVPLVSSTQAPLSTTTMLMRHRSSSSCATGEGFELEFSRLDTPPRIPSLATNYVQSEGGASSISKYDNEVSPSFIIPSIGSCVETNQRLPLVTFNLESPPQQCSPNWSTDAPLTSPHPSLTAASVEPPVPPQISLRIDSTPGYHESRPTSSNTDRISLSLITMVPFDDQPQRPIRTLSLRLRPDDSWIIKQKEENGACKSRTFSEITSSRASETQHSDEDGVDRTVERKESYQGHHTQMFQHQTPLTTGVSNR